MAWTSSEDSRSAARSDQSLLPTWRKLGSLATHWVHTKDSDQTGWMPRLIWVFAGCTSHFVGFVVRWLIWDRAWQNLQNDSRSSKDSDQQWHSSSLLSKLSSQGSKFSSYYTSSKGWSDISDAQADLGLSFVIMAHLSRLMTKPTKWPVRSDSS